mgnify:CR=1 FL=1
MALARFLGFDDEIGLRRVKLKKQSLLYLTAGTTNVEVDVVAIRLIEDGKVQDVSDDPKDWPYHSVLDAINDGWRVIKFPEQALLLSEDRNYGLGHDFVLERIEQ